MINYFLNEYGSELFTAIIIHLKFVLISVSVGFIIAFFAGIGLSRFPKISKVVLPILGVFQTIPGLVFIGVLFLFTGIY